MRIAVKALVLAHLSLTFGLCSFAGAATISNKQTASKPDTRLNQKLDYEAEFKTIGSILEELSERTGVKMRGGSSSEDWPVRSRRMNIFAHDIRLIDLMNSMANTMKFTWRINNEVDPPTYRLVVNYKAAAAADAQKAKAEKLLEELWQKRRDKWVDLIEKDGVLTSTQIDAMRETDPIRYRYAKQGASRALRALFHEVPEAKSRFMAGRGFRISAEDLSEETRALIMTAGDEFLKFMQRGWGDNPTGLTGVYPPNAKLDVAYERMDIDTFMPNLRWSIFSQGSVGYFHFSKDGDGREIADLKDIDSPFVRALSERENKIMDGQGTFKSTWATLEPSLPGLMDERQKEDDLLYPNEPLIEHEEFPELTKIVKLKTEKPKDEAAKPQTINHIIAEIERTIAKDLGLDVVSDSWMAISGDPIPDQEIELGKLLDKFSETFNYNWSKTSSGVLEFRHRKWAKMRLNQIPDEWVSEWSENTRKNGMLSLEDLAEISNLTYDQTQESMQQDKVVGMDGVYRAMLEILDRNVTWLRIYSTLSPQLKTLLMSQFGINGQMLTANQWKKASILFDRIGASRSDARFLLERVPNETETIYRFREIDPDTGTDDRKWEIWLPKYVAPPSKEAPKQ